MKNYEKYKDSVIKSIKINNICDLAEQVYGDKCSTDRKCSECRKRVGEWLDEECKEPQIDWSKVPVDIPVIIKDTNGLERIRHFCKYEPNFTYPFIYFSDGKTSFTGDATSFWYNCKLARQEDIEKYSI